MKYWVMMVVGVALLLAACNLQKSVYAPTFPGYERTPAEQNAAAVKISACGAWGSGVIVGPNRVLTAFHVVNRTCSTLMVITRDRVLQAYITGVAPQIDVAVLGLHVPEDKPIKGARATIAPPPGLGKDVCIVPMVPRSGRRCGAVQYRSDWRIQHTATTQPGNSGSGVYDRGGRLVGIVTHLYRCSNGQICGGLATPVHDQKWLFL